MDFNTYQQEAAKTAKYHTTKALSKLEKFLMDGGDFSGIYGQFWSEHEDDTLSDLVRQVRKELSLGYLLTAAYGEGGELANLIKKYLRGDPIANNEGAVTDELKDKITLELGDQFWYLARICSELNLSMEEVARRNIEKLADRKDKGTIKDDGRVR